MHVRVASAVLASAVASFVGVIGIAAVNAAELSNGQNAGGYGYAAYGARMEPVIIYDDQPGVIVRSYWDTPWDNRHYFPRTGRKPKVGRLEHISAHPRISRAQSYFRYWSASSVFIGEIPGGPVPGPGPGYGIPPRQSMELPR